MKELFIAFFYYIEELMENALFGRRNVLSGLDRIQFGVFMQTNEPDCHS